MTSLPVPVSPVVKRLYTVLATASAAWLRIERRLPRRPSIVSRNEESVRSNLRASVVGRIGGIYQYTFWVPYKLHD